MANEEGPAPPERPEQGFAPARRPGDSGAALRRPGDGEVAPPRRESGPAARVWPDGGQAATRPEDGRAALARLIVERGEDYAGLSRLLGRNPAYIQQYIKRGTPRRLAEADRHVLARYFGVEDRLLGGPADAGDRRAMVTVRSLDVGAAAGAGAYDGDERGEAHIAFDPAWLRRVARGRPEELSIIRVAGDSMAPTLADGDDILVDRGDGAARVRDGIYAVRIEGALVVKRIGVNPSARTVSIRSDNPAYPGWPDCDPSSIDIVGRVVWTGRRLG